MRSLLPEHLRARQVHESRWDNLARARDNWRIAAFLCISLVIFDSILIWRLATQGRVQTYVVEVDRFGNPRFAGSIEQKDVPEDRLWRWTLSLFIQHIRTVPSSPEILRAQLATASAFLQGRAIETVRVSFERQNPFTLAKTVTVAVDPQVVVLRRAKNLWQLEWTETHSDISGTKTQQRWTALVTTARIPPTLKRNASGGPDDLQYLNPLGLFITELDWSLVRTL